MYRFLVLYRADGSAVTVWDMAYKGTDGSDEKPLSITEASLIELATALPSNPVS